MPLAVAGNPAALSRARRSILLNLQRLPLVPVNLGLSKDPIFLGADALRMDPHDLMSRTKSRFWYTVGAGAAVAPLSPAHGGWWQKGAVFWADTRGDVLSAHQGLVHPTSWFCNRR